MRSFIHRKNLENFRKQLAETIDLSKRNQLLTLLREEEAKERPALRRESDDV